MSNSTSYLGESKVGTIKYSIWKLVFNRLAILALLLYLVPRDKMHVTINKRHVTHVHVLRASNKSSAILSMIF